MHVTLGLIFVASLRKEWPMTFIAVRCPHCQSEQIVKRGKTARGTQRYLCQNTRCAKGSFLLDYRNRGYLPEVKQTIIDMSLNASEVRDTVRSLHICPNTILRELKKKEAALESVNTALLRTLTSENVAVDSTVRSIPGFGLGKTSPLGSSRPSPQSQISSSFGGAGFLARPWTNTVT